MRGQGIRRGRASPVTGHAHEQVCAQFLETTGEGAGGGGAVVTVAQMMKARPLACSQVIAGNFFDFLIRETEIVAVPGG